MSIHNKINVAVIGATGYTGLDLILMLSKHPKVNLINLCATKKKKKKVSYFTQKRMPMKKYLYYIYREVVSVENRM